MDGKYSQKPAKTTAKPAFTSGSHCKSSQSREEPLKSPKAGRSSPLPHEGTPSARTPQPAPQERRQERRPPAPQVPATRVRPLTSAPHGGAAKLAARRRSPPGCGRPGVGTSRRVKPSLCPRPPSLAVPLPARLETASERDAGTGAPARPPAPCERRGRGEPRGRDSGSLS